MLQWETLLEQWASSWESRPFCGPVANFYSLKTEKIPTGRVALGDWLGCYRVGNSVSIFTKHGVRDLASLDHKAQGNSCYGAW